MSNDPTVPLDKVMPSDAQTILIVVMALGCAAIWIYALAESRRRRDIIPLLIVAGAGLSVWYEPLGDELAKVYYTEQGQETWIHAFGRDIPVFIGLLYFWYMSLGAMWLLRVSERGVTAKQWWTAWGGMVVFATFLEMFVIQVFDTSQGAPWIYYDTQPFVVLDVPLFTPWTYASIDVAIASGAVALARFLPQGRRWLVLPAVPPLMLAGHITTAWPSALALQSTNDQLLLHLGALGSGLLAILLSYTCSLAYRRPLGPNSPAARQAAEPPAAALTPTRDAVPA